MTGAPLFHVKIKGQGKTNEMGVTFTAGTTATTITFTTGSTAGTGTPVAKKEEPKPEPEKTATEKMEEVLASLKYVAPVAIPPPVYRTCQRCSVSVDVAAFQGRCSVCGGPLVNR